MTQKKAHCLLLVLIIAAVYAGAQEYNSVPLDHEAYDIIEMGIMYGIISPPPSAKPWPQSTVTKMLWEILDDPGQVLSSRELDAVSNVYDTFDRKSGLDLKEGRYRAEDGNDTFETGLAWESFFSVSAPDGSIASVNTMKLYAAGDFAYYFSWNVTALGEFLYIDRDNVVSPFFPYTCSRTWDGGVLSLRNAGAYSAWPGDPAVAGGFFAELNGAFLNEQLHLRIGRLRRDWGPQANGTSLYLNAHARPFTAIEGTYSPLAWLNLSLMNGALEYFREDKRLPDKGPFVNMISMGQVEINPVRFFHFGMGGSVIWLDQINAAFFANLELRVPRLLKLWGSLFVDQVDSFPDNFFNMNNNNYAYQAGLKVLVYWLPFGVFTIRYTKVEPYCYTNAYDRYNGKPIPSSSAHANGGESLGHYMPPNSEELLLRLESRPFPDIKAYVQFQSMRHGADYGDWAVPGSSIRDKLTDGSSKKYFLMDGAYRQDNVIKLGGSCNIRAWAVPVSVYGEMGLVIRRFTINGDAGVGNEADYEPLDNNVYRAGNNFIFSVGFKVFSH